MSSLKSISDTELISLLELGDHSAFTEVFNRYWDQLYLHALKMLGDEDEAKDVVQELFTSLFEKSGEIDFRSSLSGYLYVSLRNKVLNYIRKKKTRSTFEEDLSIYIDTNQHNVIEKITEKELTEALALEIKNLPPKMREVFLLSRNEQLSYKEISEELKISTHTVKRQISNALKIIRIKLSGTIGLLIPIIFSIILKK